jgi:uncharacterized phiE125 gp8 family phage protein
MYWGDDESWTRYRTSVHFAQTLVTPPVEEPLSVSEAKSHLRSTTTAEDDQVWAWIRAAREQVERDADVALLTQTWDIALDGFPGGFGMLRLLKRPLQSVTWIRYTDAVGVIQTLATNQYVLDTSSRTPRIGLTDIGSWPAVAVRQFQPVTVRVVVGWASAGLIPESLLQAVKMWLPPFQERRGMNDNERGAYDWLIASHQTFVAQ